MTPRDIRSAATALAARLRFVHQDENYMGVWQLAQAHLGPYQGATYTNELEELEAALEAADSPAPVADAERALARFGADVVASHRAPGGGWVQPALLSLPDIARDTGVTVDGQLAPGIAEAVQRLLAPDGTVTDG